MTSKEEWLDKIEDDNSYILDIPNEYKNKEFYLEVVKRDGFALRYIEEQDKEIYLEAVKNYGFIIALVKEEFQTYEIINIAFNNMSKRYKDYIDFIKNDKLKDIFKFKYGIE